MNRIEALAWELLGSEKERIAVRKAGSYRFPSSYRYEPHRHREYEVNYIDSGKCVMTFEEEYVPLRAGECIIISPGYRHGFLVDAKAGCKIVQAEMTIPLPEMMTGEFPFGDRNHPYCRIRDCQDVVLLIQQVARYHRNQQTGEYLETLLDLSVLQLVTALGWHLNREEDVRTGIGNRKILGMMKYIQEHYTEPIRIEELAGRWNMSSRYVRRYFSQEVGMTCQEYITVLRINRAKELLWETEKTITQIAMETGYGTPQYFCRVFGSQAGVSPSRYRDIWKEKKI